MLNGKVLRNAIGRGVARLIDGNPEKHVDLRSWAPKLGGFGSGSDEPIFFEISLSLWAIADFLITIRCRSDATWDFSRR